MDVSGLGKLWVLHPPEPRQYLSIYLYVYLLPIYTCVFIFTYNYIYIYVHYQFNWLILYTTFYQKQTIERLVRRSFLWHFCGFPPGGASEFSPNRCEEFPIPWEGRSRRTTEVCFPDFQIRAFFVFSPFGRKQGRWALHEFRSCMWFFQTSQEQFY